MRNRTRCHHKEYEDKEEDRIEKHPAKIRRMKEHSYDHIGKVQLVNKGYLCMPDKMWMKELSKEEKDFVVNLNSRIRFGEMTDNMISLQDSP
eukprot:6114636-Ditylum_brightwellii.AAC.1